MTSQNKCLAPSETVLAGRLLEESEGCQRLAVDVLGLEEREDLLGKPPDFRSSSQPQVEDRQIERRLGVSSRSREA